MARENATLPLFPLGSVLFPGAQLPLHIFEERYRALLRDHLHDDPIFGVVLTRAGHEVGDEPEIHRVGTAAHLLGANEFPDGRWAIVVQGTRRFEVGTSTWAHGYLVADVRWIEEQTPVVDATTAARTLIDSFVAYLAAVTDDVSGDQPIAEIAAGLRTVLADDLPSLIYIVSAQLPLNTWHRQRILEMASLDEQFAHVRDLLRQERTILERAGATTWLTSHPGSMILPN